MFLELNQEQQIAYTNKVETLLKSNKKDLILIALAVLKYYNHFDNVPRYSIKQTVNVELEKLKFYGNKKKFKIVFNVDNVKNEGETGNCDLIFEDGSNYGALNDREQRLLYFYKTAYDHPSRSGFVSSILYELFQVGKLKSGEAGSLNNKIGVLNNTGDLSLITKEGSKCLGNLLAWYCGFDNYDDYNNRTIKNVPVKLQEVLELEGLIDKVTIDQSSRSVNKKNGEATNKALLNRKKSILREYFDQSKLSFIKKEKQFAFSLGAVPTILRAVKLNADILFGLTPSEHITKTTPYIFPTLEINKLEDSSPNLIVSIISNNLEILPEDERLKNTFAERVVSSNTKYRIIILNDQISSANQPQFELLSKIRKFGEQVGVDKKDISRLMNNIEIKVVDFLSSHPLSNKRSYPFNFVPFDIVIYQGVFWPGLSKKIANQIIFSRKDYVDIENGKNRDCCAFYRIEKYLPSDSFDSFDLFLPHKKGAILLEYFNDLWRLRPS